MKNYAIELKWAFLFIGMTLLWMLLEKLSGLHDEHIEQHPIVTNLIAIPAILLYVLALRDKKKNFYNGAISYRQAFMAGLIMTAVITLFVPITQYITSAIITPNYFDNMIAYSVDHGKSTQAEAEAYFNMKNYIIQSVIFTPAMGIVTTAIVALFVRTKNKG
jgi:hypothetical protein